MIDEMKDHEFDDLADTRLLALLNDQYQDVCSRFLWPFLETSVPITVDANGVLGGWPTDLAHIKSLYLTTDPLFYNILNDDTNFFLTSGSQPSLIKSFNAQALTLVYYKVPADLTAVTSPIFSFRHHRVVVLGALARAYFMTDDLQLGQAFEGQYEGRINHMYTDMLKRDVAPRKRYDVTDF